METITALILSALLLLSMVNGTQHEIPDIEPTVTPPAPVETVVTEPEAKEEPTIGTAKTAVDVYSSPITGSRVVARLKPGEQVEILRRLSTGSAEWLCIYLPNQAVIGCVKENAVTESDDITPAEIPEVIPANARMGVVTSPQLNIRTAPGVNNDKIGTYHLGDRVAILETNSGWGRTTKGWVSMSYVYLDGTTGRYTMTGYVTASQLRIRSGPGTDYAILGTLAQGSKVQILEQIQVGSVFWGCTRNGWVCMSYVRPETLPNIDESTAALGYGLVTGDRLNIRTDAGTNHASIGSLKKGDLIVIWEIVKVGDVEWGRTSQGWVCMNYITMVEVSIKDKEEDKPEETTKPTEPTKEEPKPTEATTAPTETTAAATKPTETTAPATTTATESTTPTTAATTEATEPSTAATTDATEPSTAATTEATEPSTTTEATEPSTVETTEATESSTEESSELTEPSTEESSEPTETSSEETTETEKSSEPDTSDPNDEENPGKTEAE